MKTFVLEDYLALAVAAAAIAGVTGYFMGVKEKDSAKAQQAAEAPVPNSLQMFRWSGDKRTPHLVLELLTDNGVYCVAIESSMQCDFSKRIPPAEFSKAFSFGAQALPVAATSGTGEAIGYEKGSK